MMGDAEPVESVLPDGSLLYDYAPEAAGSAAPGEIDFDANLAGQIDGKALKSIAKELIDLVDTDRKARSPWHDKIRTGMRLLGVTAAAADDGPFEGAADVNHPVLGQAVVQFNARAIAELFPSGGPVKSQIIGDATEAKRQQCERVEAYMNYQLTEENPSYYDELDQMLFRLPLDGSAFKKVARDTLLGINTSTFLRADELVVPYTATSLEDAPRYTHDILMHRNELRKLQVNGTYLDVDLKEPDEEDDGGMEGVRDVMDDADSREPDLGDDDSRHRLLEIHIDYDLPGFEDPDGIALPYIITVEQDSQQVLAIRRNWREADPLRRKRIWFVHYKFLPGTGFYGFGLLHMIGDLAVAATGALRCLLDSAALASLQGGFKAKDVRAESGELVIQPGVYQDVDMTAEELAKAFYTPNFKEPSPTLFQLLGMMVDEARRFASVTEAMVGDAANTGPVGTTVALIEQGSKVYTGIHKRLHKAQRMEFKLLAELNYENLPDEYPYDVAGASRIIKRDDFDARVDVLPVSDPNIFSSTQRLALAQATLEMVAQFPEDMNRREAIKRMLEALQVPQPESLLKSQNLIPRLDPISEMAYLMAGKPIKAFADQDHAAHLSVHQAALEHVKTMNPEQAQPLTLQLMEHMAKHHAYQLYAEMGQMTGMPLPPLDLYAEPGEAVKNEMPAEVETQVSQAAAQMAGQMAEFFASRQPPPPEDMETKADIERKNQKAMADEQRKQAQFEAEQQRKMAAFSTEQEMEKIKTMAEIELDGVKAEAEIDIMEDKADVEMDIAEERAEQQADIADEQAASGMAQGMARHAVDMDAKQQGNAMQHEHAERMAKHKEKAAAKPKPKPKGKPK